MVASSAPICSPTEGIAKALRACGICSPTPQAANWVLADRIDGTRARPNGQVQARWDGGTTPAQNSRGYHAHLRGIWLRGIVELTLGAGHSAVSAHQLRQLWSSIFLESTANWQYLSDVDGRVLVDDVWFRHGQHLQTRRLQAGVQGLDSPIITVDGGVAAGPARTEFRDFSVFFPLVTLGPGRSKTKGLVPLAALQRFKSGGLRWRMSNTILGSNGVTIAGFFQPTDPTASGVELWTDLVYMPSVVVDSMWNVDSYELSDSGAILMFPERKSEYAWLRHNAEDAPAGAGQALAAQYDGITLTVAGFNILSGETQAVVRDRGIGYSMSLRDSAWNRDNAAQDLPQLDATGASQALCLLSYATREGAAAGDIAYRFTTRPAGNPQIRFAHRTDACHDAVRAAKIVRATRCGPCLADRPVIGEDCSPSGRIGPNEPMLLQLQQFAE